MTTEFPNDTRDLMDRLDEALPPHTRRIHETGYDPLVSVARRLAQGPDAPLSEAALDRIEARLRAQAIELQRPVPARKHASRQRSRQFVFLRYAVAACLIILLVFSGAARASAHTLPGDSLYPVKRAIENGRLALASDEGEATLRVNLAARRIEEFDRLLDRHEIYPPVLEEASKHFTRALDLLVRGYGDSDLLGERILALSARQTILINYALPIAAPEERQQLRMIAVEAVQIQERALASGLVPNLEPVLAATISSPTATFTASDTFALTVETQAAPASTPTAMPTLVPTVRQKPTVAVETVDGHGGKKTKTPPVPELTRTPPGQSGNRPGQGGNNNNSNNSGNGNNGNPSGGNGNNGGGNNGNPPGQDEGNPGNRNSGNPPGQDGGNPGNSGNAPGQNGNNGGGNNDKDKSNKK